MKFVIDGKEIEVPIFDPKDDMLSPNETEEIEVLDVEEQDD